MKLKFFTGFALMCYLLQPHAAEIPSPKPMRESNTRLGIMLGTSDTDISAINSAGVYQIYAESSLNKWLGVRLGYRETENFVTGNTSQVELEYSETLHIGINLSFPHAGQFRPYAGAQYINWKLESRGAGQLLGKTDGEEIGIIAGLGFDLSKSLGINLEYGQINDIDDANIEYIQFGVYLRL